MKRINRRLYVGVCKDLSRHTFRSATTPLPMEWHLPQDPNGKVHVREPALQFSAVIGPFRTKAGADFMRDYGQGNPHCQCVSDAEKLAKIYKEKAKSNLATYKAKIAQINA